MTKKYVKPYIKIVKKAFNYSKEPKTWLAALLGAGAMEAFFRLAPQIGLTRIDNATANGTIFLPPGKKASFLGGLIFYTGAVSWVALFRTLKPKIKGHQEVQSLKFGIVVFLVSSFLFPIVGWVNPYMRKGILKNPGLFGLRLQGWKTVISNLIGHAIFISIVRLKTK